MRTLLLNVGLPVGQEFCTISTVKRFMRQGVRQVGGNREAREAHFQALSSNFHSCLNSATASQPSHGSEGKLFGHWPIHSSAFFLVKLKGVRWVGGQRGRAAHALSASTNFCKLAWISGSPFYCGQMVFSFMITLHCIIGSSFGPYTSFKFKLQFS